MFHLWMLHDMQCVMLCLVSSFVESLSIIFFFSLLILGNKGTYNFIFMKFTNFTHFLFLLRSTLNFLNYYSVG